MTTHRRPCRHFRHIKVGKGRKRTKTVLVNPHIKRRCKVRKKKPRRPRKPTPPKIKVRIVEREKKVPFVIKEEVEKPVFVFLDFEKRLIPSEELSRLLVDEKAIRDVRIALGSIETEQRAKELKKEAEQRAMEFRMFPLLKKLEEKKKLGKLKKRIATKRKEKKVPFVDWALPSMLGKKSLRQRRFEARRAERRAGPEWREALKRARERRIRDLRVGFEQARFLREGPRFDIDNLTLRRLRQQKKEESDPARKRALSRRIESIKQTGVAFRTLFAEKEVRPKKPEVKKAPAPIKRKQKKVVEKARPIVDKSQITLPQFERQQKFEEFGKTHKIPPIREKRNERTGKFERVDLNKEFGGVGRK